MGNETGKHKEDTPLQWIYSQSSLNLILLKLSFLLLMCNPVLFYYCIVIPVCVFNKNVALFGSYIGHDVTSVQALLF